MKKIFVAAFIGLVAVLGNGCASFSAHSGREPEAGRGPFPGARADLAVVVGVPSAILSENKEEACLASSLLGMVPFFAADLPLSLAVDTLFLPHDSVSLVFRRDKKTCNPPPAPAYPPPPRNPNGGCSRQTCPNSTPCPPRPQNTNKGDAKCVLDFWR